MAETATTFDKSKRIPEKDLLELERLTKKMQESGDPVDAEPLFQKMGSLGIPLAQMGRDMLYRQDFSNLPPEARQSFEKLKMLDEQIKEIEEKELAPVSEKLLKSALLTYGAMVTGSIAAIGTSIYLTRGMSLLPRALIGFGSGGVGFWGGFLATKNQTSRANAEYNTISEKVAELENQVNKERGSLNANRSIYAEQLVNSLETSNTPSTTHAATLTKSPGIAEMAASKPTASHVAAVQADDSHAGGCKLR